MGIAGNTLVKTTTMGFAVTIQPASAADSRVHPDRWPTVQPALAPDPALESRITALLAGMTLEQKVGQVIQADIASITPDDLRHFSLGSILNGGNSSPNGDEFAPPSEWLALADRFYETSMDPATQGPHPIPTIWGTDAVHGHNNIVGASFFLLFFGFGVALVPVLFCLFGVV